jgi:hypothetical protein
MASENGIPATRVHDIVHRLPAIDWSIREEPGHYYARWKCGKAWARVWVTTDSWGDWRVGELIIGGWYAVNNVTKESVPLRDVPHSAYDPSAYSKACRRVEAIANLREALDICDPAV